MKTLPLENSLAELLAVAKAQLEQLYGDRMRGVYLFGSRARGEASPDSDVDLAIVLDEIPDYAEEIERTGDLIAALARRYDLSVSRVVLSQRQWQRGGGPFLITARRDAVAA